MNIREINQYLEDKYGEPSKMPEMSGVNWVVETILSQNTNDKNRDKAFKKLTERYDSWKEVENADYEELVDTIRIAGLGPTKAERIQRALTIIREKSPDEDEYSVEFLDDISLEDAKKWLTDIPGIGPKTASVILAFHFDKPTIPVDTHVYRLSKRLGLVPENVSREKAHEILEEKVPDDIKYEFHRLLIKHGRETCTARVDGCELCQELVPGNHSEK
ncbi:MAG: endonuclease III [Candidatus Nanohaloarchaea archaeon]